MFDYHTALTDDRLRRQQLSVTVNDDFKKDIYAHGESNGYLRDVDVWMLPSAVPCQAIPVRTGMRRDIVVLPLFTDTWFQVARENTFSEQPIWEVCKIISFLLTNAAMVKGAKFPRFPFVVCLDPTIRPRDEKPMIIYTTDPRITLTNVRYVEPVRIRSQTEMMEQLIHGAETNRTLRLVRVKRSVKEQWFWEPISYLTALRLQTLSYDTNGKMKAEMYGMVNNQIIAPALYKVGEDFANVLSDNQSEYIDTELLIRFPRKDATIPVTEDIVSTGSICGPYDPMVDFGPNNLVLAL